MATREENLKKINAELEKLDEDELDKVAGGLIKTVSSVDAPSLRKPNQNPSEQPRGYAWEIRDDV